MNILHLYNGPNMALFINNVILIRVVAGVLAVVVLAILIWRTKKKGPG
jgi:hypothetical protein